jgi:hypothetical protein
MIFNKTNLQVHALGEKKDTDDEWFIQYTLWCRINSKEKR